MTDKDQINQLEEKISELQDILGELLAQPKQLATIVAGPFTNKDSIYYRAKQGESPLIATYKGDILFGDTSITEIKEGTEVVLLNGAIVDIVPEVLKPKIKVKNTFKLISWNEVGGLKSQVERIKQAVEGPLKNAKVAQKYGLEPIKGILLYGPPGCGKTLVAKAIASTILKDSDGEEGSFVYIKAAELLSMYVGATEQRIIQLFKGCREYAQRTGKRSVFFIDEAEAILPKRGSRRSSDVDTTIVPTFLSEMDGFDDGSPIVILSTNLPEQLDEAILRPGRIDLKLEVNRPTKEDAEEIFGIHLSKVLCAESQEDIAKNASEFIFNTSKKDKISGAVIQAAIKLATQKAMNREINNPKIKHPGVTAIDVRDAIVEL